MQQRKQEKDDIFVIFPAFYFYFCLHLATYEQKHQEMTTEEYELFARKIRPRLLAVGRDFASVSMAADADDIAQETLMKLWEMTRQDYPIRDAEALAVRMAKNICISHYRKVQQKPRLLAHDNYTGGTEATTLTDAEDLAKIKDTAYGTLTRTQKEYMHLRNDEEMTLDEIAQLTGRPKTSIKSSISAARRQLLDMIKAQL